VIIRKYVPTGVEPAQSPAVSANLPTRAVPALAESDPWDELHAEIDHVHALHERPPLATPGHPPQTGHGDVHTGQPRTGHGEVHA